MGADLQLTGDARRKQLPRLPRAGREQGSRHGRPANRLADLRVTLFDESEEDFVRFQRAFAAALCPKDALEEFLVERIVTSAWRLRRIYRIESGLYAKARVSVHSGKLKRTRDIELVFLRLTSHDDDLAKLARYEASLERSLYQAVRQLAGQRRPRNGSFLRAFGGEFAASCP